jgi:hypothetical protein
MFETVQCVRYGASQECVTRRTSCTAQFPSPSLRPSRLQHRYRLHNDWFNPAEDGYADKMLNGGQRRVSIFIYLQQPAAGGCTWFPHLGPRGVAFAPVVGHGVMWCAAAHSHVSAPAS